MDTVQEPIRFDFNIPCFVKRTDVLKSAIFWVVKSYISEKSPSSGKTYPLPSSG
jgi:hypothetical protein